MLIGIGIENFKGLKKCEILNLGKVNVFVGRNNSGKSSILDALCLIRTAFNYYLHDEPLPTVLLRRKAIERSAYVTRNFWYNYDTSQKIKFNLEFRDEGKLNIETSWTGDTRLLMLFEDPSNKLNKIDGKNFSRVEIDITTGIVNFDGGFHGFSSIFPNFFNFLRNIVLIDDYLARKLEKLEKSVFRGILEPRLDKKVVEELNEIYDV